MKRLATALLIGVAGFWIIAHSALGSGKPIGVVTSVIPVAYVVEELGGERVEVKALVPPGASPHTFEPVPSDMRRIAAARLFFVIGGGFDAWSDKLLGAAPAGLETVHLIEAPNLKPLEGEDDHHGEEHGEEKAGAKEEDHHDEEKKVAAKKEEHHGEEKVAAKEEDHHGEEKATAKKEEDHGEEGEEFNPHFWLDPIRVRDAVVPVIVEHLIEADPAGKAYYQKRREDFHRRLTALDQEIRGELDKAKSRKYIAFHAAWPYFAERYGLEKVAVVQEFGGEEPTPREVANLVRDARAAGVGAILVEPQLNPRVAQTIAAEFGAGTVVVDPVGDPGDPARSSYEKLMRFNTRAFGNALGGKRN